MPTASRREKILDNIEERLKFIRQVDGYFNTVEAGNIQRVLGIPTNITEFPALFIIAGPEDAEDTPTGYVTSRFLVGISAWIKGTLETLPQAIENILSDIKKLMQVDTTRGGNAIDTSYTGVGQPTLNEITAPVGFIDISFTVTYRTLREDPSQ